MQSDTPGTLQSDAPEGPPEAHTDELVGALRLELEAHKHAIGALCEALSAFGYRVPLPDDVLRASQGASRLARQAVPS